MYRDYVGHPTPLGYILIYDNIIYRMAYMELYMAFANVFRRFDMTIHETT